MKHSALIASIVIAGGLVAAFFGYRWCDKSGFCFNKNEQTLAIIKPDAVKAHHTGKIIDQIEHAGFTIVDIRKITFSKDLAERFYEAHQGKKFFDDLVAMMSSGQIVVMILEKSNAIAEWRKFMGATDPSQAEEGTMRKMFGVDITRNATHGSDSPEAAEREIALLFGEK